MMEMIDPDDTDQSEKKDLEKDSSDSEFSSKKGNSSPVVFEDKFVDDLADLGQTKEKTDTRNNEGNKEPTIDQM